MGDRTSHGTGVRAEQAAAEALIAEGWTVLARRLRTGAGEIDLVASRGRQLAFVEVKCRPSLAEAAQALSPRQQGRLMAAAEAALAAHPEWNESEIRFDLIAVDTHGRARRIADAFRAW
jgi:putative endonuclease